MAIEIVAPNGSAVVVSPNWTVTAETPSNTVNVVANVAVMPTYRGEYEITPGQQAQVLETSGLMMDRDLTVGAIPSNYGLITYNGSVITVS